MTVARGCGIASLSVPAADTLTDMSRGPGRVRREILRALGTLSGGRDRHSMSTRSLAELVYRQAPTEAQLSAIRRAARGLAAEGRIERSATLHGQAGYRIAEQYIPQVQRAARRAQARQADLNFTLEMGCPYCGANAAITHHWDDSYTVKCLACGIFRMA